MVKVKANNGTSLEVQNKDGMIFINNEPVHADVLNTGKGRYHVLYNNVSYEVLAEDIDPVAKTCTILVNGKKVSMQLKDTYDELLEKMGFSADAGSRVKELKAPMPGLVLRMLVKEGDEVKKGDGSLVLEAMKMENILKSMGDGTVRKIHVSEKNTVEKGQILISFQ